MTSTCPRTSANKWPSRQPAFIRETKLPQGARRRVSIYHCLNISAPFPLCGIKTQTNVPTFAPCGLYISSSISNRCIISSHRKIHKEQLIIFIGACGIKEATLGGEVGGTRHHVGFWRVEFHLVPRLIQAAPISSQTPPGYRATNLHGANSETAHPTRAR